MKKVGVTIPLSLLLTISLMAQKSEVFNKSAIAVNGYDVVAYFTEHKPVKGAKEFTYYWKEANWQFSNRQNLDSFKASPEKYTPQFGGYCAYGISEGHKAPTDPEAWAIVDGRLYLNYNKDVQVMWKKEQSSRIQKSNQNWAELKNKE